MLPFNFQVPLFILITTPHVLHIAMTKVTKCQRREAQRASQSANGEAQLPKKKLYRQRAHANPFSDHALT